jgi:hypothetical protein
MGLGHLAILHLLVVYLLDNRDLGVCCTGSLDGTLASTLVTVNRTLNASFVTGASNRLTATCTTESVVRVLRLEDQVPLAPPCEALDGVATKVSSCRGLSQSFTRIYIPAASWAISWPAG